MYRALISYHMQELKPVSAPSREKLNSKRQRLFKFSPLIQENFQRSACPGDRSEAVLRFNELSSKMCSAIFTSCFELSSVSCPLTSLKLADLM